MEGTLALRARVSMLSGTVSSMIPADYGNLFQPGPGVSLEGTLLFPVAPGWKLGPFVSATWDTFSGVAYPDAIGDTLKPEGMDLYTFLAGARGIYDLGNHFDVDLYLGIGVSCIPAVPGVLTLSGIPSNVTVFGSSTVLAAVFGARFAYEAKPVFFDLGVDIRTVGAPANGDLAFDSLPMLVASFEFGVGIRF
jgi:hypothetical protein